MVILPHKYSYRKGENIEVSSGFRGYCTLNNRFYKVLKARSALWDYKTTKVIA